MIKLNKLVAIAVLCVVGTFGISAASYANEDVKAACTQQAEEDGYAGEDKANAIKECMEQAAAATSEESSAK